MKQIFEVRYIDNQSTQYDVAGKNVGFNVNLAKGKPVLIEAKSIQEAMQEALYRCQKKIDYSVGSIVRVL